MPGGNPIGTLPSIANPFAYTGREWDKETGLYYYRARYYTSQIGRFISEDPIGFTGGINLYVYVGNNPVNKIDPLGLIACNGTWKEQGDPDWSFMACRCYWLCIPCNGSVIWGGNKRTLVSTTGMTIWNPKNSKYTCNCDKPGPDKNVAVTVIPPRRLLGDKAEIKVLLGGRGNNIFMKRVYLFSMIFICVVCQLNISCSSQLLPKEDKDVELLKS